MFYPFQAELFCPEQFTRVCSTCRRDFPRTQAFFPSGRSKDGMSTVCRQCSKFKVLGNTSETTQLSDKTLLERKTCEDCDRLKFLNEFYMDSHTLDGKSRWCKHCSKTRNDARRERQKIHGEDAWAVFFIQDTRNLRVKIGCSNDPYESFANLQQASSVSLKLLTVLEAGNKTEAESRESELHRLFESSYEGHGWFECISSLHQYIVLIQQEGLNNRNPVLSPSPMRAKPKRNRQHPEVVRVEGQIFPNLTAARAATGYSNEQMQVQTTDSELSLFLFPKTGTK